MAEIHYVWHRANAEFPSDGKDVIVRVYSLRRDLEYTTIGSHASYSGWTINGDVDLCHVLKWTELPVPSKESDDECVTSNSELEEIKENLLNLTTKMNTVESELGVLKENVTNTNKR